MSDRTPWFEAHETDDTNPPEPQTLTFRGSRLVHGEELRLRERTYKVGGGTVRVNVTTKKVGSGTLRLNGDEACVDE